MIKVEKDLLFYKSIMMNIGNYEFSEPYLLEENNLLNIACIYAVLYKTIGGFQLVYIGESGQVANRLSNHERYSCWRTHSSGNLYVAIFITPSIRYSEDQRRTLERELIDRYDPVCNRQ